MSEFETNPSKLVVQEGPNEGNIVAEEGLDVDESLAGMMAYAEKEARFPARPSEKEKAGTAAAETAAKIEIARRMLKNAGRNDSDAKILASIAHSQEVHEAREVAGGKLIKEQKKHTEARKKGGRRVAAKEKRAREKQERIASNEAANKVYEQIYGKGITGKVKRFFHEIINYNND